MVSYLLNAAVLTAFGRYTFKEISIDEARLILNEGYISAIGHSATAKILSTLLGLQVEVNRINSRQEIGDRAIVFWLSQRQPEGVVLQTVEEIEKIGFKFGLIIRETEEKVCDNNPLLKRGL